MSELLTPGTIITDSAISFFEKSVQCPLEPDVPQEKWFVVSIDNGIVALLPVSEKPVENEIGVEMHPFQVMTEIPKLAGGSKYWLCLGFLITRHIDDISPYGNKEVGEKLTNESYQKFKSEWAKFGIITLYTNNNSSEEEKYGTAYTRRVLSVADDWRKLTVGEVIDSLDTYDLPFANDLMHDHIKSCIKNYLSKEPVDQLAINVV